MSKLSRFIAVLLASSALAVSSASAALYNFTYTFDDSTFVTGSLTGDQNGQFLDNVANVSFSINGVVFAEPVFTSSFDFMPAIYVAGPVVSFDLAQNNFAFATSDLTTFDYSYNYLFSILGTPTGIETVTAYTYDPYVGAQESSDTPVRWSLTLAPVPEAGSTFALCGLALLGLIAGRRFRR